MAGFSNDEMNSFDSGVGVQQRQHFLREHSAACAGHTYGEDFFGLFLHDLVADKFSLAADFEQVKRRQSPAAMLDFSGGNYDELAGTFETSGIRAGGQARASEG